MTPFRRNEYDYFYVSDRFGDENDVVTLTEDDREALRSLGPLIWGETGFVVRRHSDGAYGILVEAVVIAHDGLPVEPTEHDLGNVQGMRFNGTTCDGTVLPKLDDVVAELRAQGDRIAEDFPDGTMEVALDGDTFDGGVALRGFAAVGSTALDRIEDFSEAMLVVYSHLKAVPAPIPQR